MTYDEFCGVFADGLLRAMATLAKVMVGLVAIAALIAVGAIFYAVIR